MVELGARPGLIVVDMQNSFCHPDGAFARLGVDLRAGSAAVEPIARLLAAGRAARLPICFARYALSSDYSDAGLMLRFHPELPAVGGLIRGTWDADVIDALAPVAGEYVFDKSRYSAFYATELETQLGRQGVDTLVVCGVTTNVCVESTVRDAFFRDFRVVVPRDATAATESKLHEGALDTIAYAFGTVTTVAEIGEALARRR